MFRCGKVILPLILATIGSGCHSTTTHHQPSGQETPTSQVGKSCVQNREAYLKLEFEVFDQDLSDGWRKIASVKGCELAAADLIEEYRFKHQTILKDRPKGLAVLNWHEGQLRAHSGQVSRAIDLFSKSYSTDSAPEWIPYAEATIAFLNRDLGELKLSKDRLMSVPEPEGWDEDVAVMNEKYSALQ